MLRHPLPAITSNLLTKGNFCHSQIFRPSYQACIGSCPSLLEPVNIRGGTILCHSITSSAVFGSVHVVSPADAHFVRSSTLPESYRYLIQCTALSIFDAVSPSHLHFIWRMSDFWWCFSSGFGIGGLARDLSSIPIPYSVTYTSFFLVVTVIAHLLLPSFARMTIMQRRFLSGCQPSLFLSKHYVVLGDGCGTPSSPSVVPLSSLLLFPCYCFPVHLQRWQHRLHVATALKYLSELFLSLSDHSYLSLSPDS